MEVSNYSKHLSNLSLRCFEIVFQMEYQKIWHISRITITGSRFREMGLSAARASFFIFIPYPSNGTFATIHEHFGSSGFYKLEE